MKTTSSISRCVKPWVDPAFAFHMMQLKTLFFDPSQEPLPSKSSRRFSLLLLLRKCLGPSGRFVSTKPILFPIWNVHLSSASSSLPPNDFTSSLSLSCPAGATPESTHGYTSTVPGHVSVCPRCLRGISRAPVPLTHLFLIITLSKHPALLPGYIGFI